MNGSGPLICRFTLALNGKCLGIKDVRKPGVCRVQPVKFLFGPNLPLLLPEVSRFTMLSLIMCSSYCQPEKITSILSLNGNENNVEKDTAC
jgi:hypothetical protein